MRASGEGIYVRVGHNANVVRIQPHSVKLRANHIESFKSGVQANLSIVGSKRFFLDAKVLNKISETLFLILRGLAAAFLRSKIFNPVQPLSTHVPSPDAPANVSSPQLSPL